MEEKRQSLCQDLSLVLNAYAKAAPPRMTAAPGPRGLIIISVFGGQRKEKHFCRSPCDNPPCEHRLSCEAPPCSLLSRKSFCGCFYNSDSAGPVQRNLRTLRGCTYPWELWELQKWLPSPGGPGPALPGTGQAHGLPGRDSQDCWE